MTPERWQQITDLFDAVLERQPTERPAYLAEVCAGDEALRAEVESLLSEHQRSGSFIANPPLPLIGARPTWRGTQNQNEPIRWSEVEKICHQALEREESQRTSFLEQACAGNEALRQDVESLLQFEGQVEDFIEKPAVEIAAKMIIGEKPESLLGQQLGAYQIVSLLGVGGMGVVYQARDMRLKRSVAIKVLPSDRVTDPERKRRFIQEARAASTLNHPNIITLHDIGSESGLDFIVMEYARGKTLDQRIPRKGLKVNEALKLAIQIADALAKAHSAGIIHRDLKPSNVMVTEDGQVKVLDFGLAKLVEREKPSLPNERQGSTHSTQSESMTEEGMILGTVSYMSPEQAEGRVVDARSDIFSFGSLLYEMVTGRKAFQGDSKISTLAAILKQEPQPLSQIASAIPTDLEKVINRCLRKDQERRFQHMSDIKVALQELKEESDTSKLTRAEQPTSQKPTLPRHNWIELGAAVAVVAIAATVWLFRGTTPKPTAAPEVVPLTSYPGWEDSPSFSPDGNEVAFSWDGEKQENTDVYVKLIGSPTPERLTRDPAEDISPAFSPDGRWIGFVRVTKSHATLIIIPAIGGPERIVAELPSGGFPSFAWLPNSPWVVAHGLRLVSTGSGETRNLTSPPGKSWLDFSPSVSPDGRTVAFSRMDASGAFEIYLLDLNEDFKPKGEPRRLTFLNAFSFGAAWTPDGREILFASGHFLVGGTSLWRVSASAAGEPERLPFSAGEAYSPAVSRIAGRLAYRRTALSDSNIWRLSLSGPGAAADPAVRFIASTRSEESAQYSPDGKRIAFESSRTGVQGIWISDADGSHAMELVSRAGAAAGTPRWSPDGQRITFDSNFEGNTDVYVIRASGGKPIRLTTDSAVDTPASWSRDGNWIYFASNRTGRFELLKVSAGGGDVIPMTRNGGETAFESFDGKSLYYTKEFFGSSALWKMPLTGGEESEVLPSVSWRAFFPVNDGIYFIPAAHQKSSIQFLSFATGKVKTVAPMSGPPVEGLSVSPDGRFLLFSQFDPNSSGTDLMLVENFR